MTNITIPPEALEAAARETYIEWVRDCLLNDSTASIDDYERWEHLDETERGHYISTARAACLALINNWPGAEWLYVSEPVLALPMPKKNSNERK